MDPDCGVRTWYLRPTFYMRIAWLIVSLIALVYVVVLVWMTNDPFFPKAMDSWPLFLAILILISIIVSITGNVMYYFKKLPDYSTAILYSACGTTALSMIFGIIYAMVFGNTTYENKVIKQCHSWLFLKGTDPATVWLKKHLFSDAEQQENQIINYADNRCTGAGETLLSILITWFIIQCLILYIHLQDDEYKDVANTAPLTGTQTHYN